MTSNVTLNYMRCYTKFRVSSFPLPLLICLLLCGTVVAEETRPNILFILADDVGQEVLGCYGGESYATPNLDALARTGMRFNHAYSMPLCHPSRITLMTGKYPFRQDEGTWGGFPESEDAYTFSNRLRNAGYKTGMAGKWQLCLLRDDPNHPQRLGFDESHMFGWHEGPRYYEPMIYHNGSVRDDTLGHYGPDLYVRSLIEFMKKNRDQPFLAYFPMALVHNVTDDLKEHVPYGPLDRWDSFPEMVAEMDRAVGRLVAALNALKLREKTLIVFVGDNGTATIVKIRADAHDQFVRIPVVSQRNGRLIPGGKGTLLNSGTSVPLIANWPGTIAPGQAVDDLVDFSDFLPTFNELAEIPLPEDQELDGRSFASVLYGTGKSSRTWAYSEEAVGPSPGGVEAERENSGLRWVRTSDWKLYSDGRLFDMQNDDREETPIRESEESQEGSHARFILQAAFKELGF